MSKKLVILGAGGYANTVKDVSEQLGYDVIAMLDDRFADRTLDSFTKYIADDTEFIPAFGNNEFRQACHCCASYSLCKSYRFYRKGRCGASESCYQYRCDSETWLYH